MLTFVQRPPESGADVVVLGVEPFEPDVLAGSLSPGIASATRSR